MITISNGSKPANSAGAGQGKGKPQQQAPQPTKTDQQILDELRQAGGGEQRRRSVGLTAFVVLLAIVIVVFVSVNNRAKNQTANNNQVAATNNSSTNNGSNASNSNVNASNNAASNQANVTTPNTTTPNGQAVGETPNAQSTTTADSYSEAAQVGEGVTHLARRALYRYLVDKHITDLSAAHKIYAEDYLSKHSNPILLNVGSTRTFSKTLLDEAVTNTRALSSAELANLQQFVAQVPGL